MTIRELANKAGVSSSCISKIKKNLKIKNKVLTKANEKAILKEAMKVSSFKTTSKKMVEKKMKPLKVNVRRIDQKDASSLLDLLQDCKERYVKNEILIQKLNNEIIQMEKLFSGNKNGTVQCVPQLTILDKYQNTNYRLRNQIVDLEEKLGKIAANAEDDPFI